MTRRTIAAALLSLTGLAASAAPLFAEPPSEERVSAAAAAMKDAIAEMRKAGAFDEAKFKAAANAAMEGLDVSEMTVEQIKTLRQAIAPSEQASAAAARLSDLAASPDKSGADAAILALTFMDAETTTAEEQADAVRVVLSHPALGAALRDADNSMLFWQLRGASPDAKRLFVGDLSNLTPHISTELPASVLRAFPEVFGVYTEAGPEHAPARERIRAALLASAMTLAADEAAPSAKAMQSLATYLDGAYAKGELIDHAAPAMTIAWSSDPAITSFADLKGKVVVVDFWATWCGPCIASFPKVQELVDHYAGYPVAVVGVTSLQGMHVGPEGRIDTKGDAAKEFGLMPEFMDRKSMGWPVVFTDEPVFNPDFGVTGIPHVAIIDPAGRVRFNGMHPGSPLEEKIAKIDPLLKEAGLPAPEAKR